ncbi:hypothetical protein SAMN05421749_10425 [Acinetobacter marinus]|uniref:Uncharacterized protein n=2 Tax=Acinetobacter marinus TaxID=281375 RepID=A0A1G6KDU6_9GAMM|nr:hypothetical protein SAMN05421749_10425 [Acinetobacter marinus]
MRMKVDIKRILAWGRRHPQKLFWIDGLGAIISVCMIGVVLVELQVLVGIPKSTLYLLALFPCIFATYDFYCYYVRHHHLHDQLYIIATMNLFYCCLSLAVAIYHRSQITCLGWIYVLAEISVITVLARFEVSVAKHLHDSPQK